MIARPTSLLVRTNLTLAVSSLAIVAIAVVALQFFVVPSDLCVVTQLVAECFFGGDQVLSQMETTG